MSEEENKGSPPPQKEGTSSEGEEANKNLEPAFASLHVGNLKYETTEETLKNIFSEIGPVVKVELIKKEDGSSKGHGFVDMENRQDAKNAIDKLNKTELDGRIITVEFKKTHEELQNDRIRNRGRGGPFYDRNPRRGNRYYRDDRDERYEDYRYGHSRYRDSRRSSRDRRDYHDYDRDRHRGGGRRSFDYDYDFPRRRRSRSPRGSRRNLSDSD